MSIVTLEKVTIFGLGVDKTKILQGLQQLGCLHLIPLQPPPKETEFGTSDRYQQAQAALFHIMDVPRRRHQVYNPTEFDLDQVIAQALENKQKRREAEDKKLILSERLETLAPWGNFTLPTLEALGGYRLWFYQIPHRQAKEIEKIDFPWQIVGDNHLSVYLVVIAKEEPPSHLLPVPRIHAGSISPKELQEQLEALEIELDDLKAEQEALSRWIFLLSQKLARAEDQVALEKARQQAKEEDGIFRVQGWIPKRSLKQLDAFAEQQGLAYLAEPPKPTEKPPTLMENAPLFREGQELVTFYETPGYRTWDPSSVVFFSFALFFAIILSDAGYALVLAVFVGIYWRSMGQTEGGKYFRSLCVAGLTLGVIYGVLVGSYFGVEPPKESLLAYLKLLNLNDYNGMMRFSIAIGCLHLAFANGVIAVNGVGFAEKAKPLGFIAVIFGGFALYQGLSHLGLGLLCGGFLVIFLGGVVGSEKVFPWGIIDGFSALIKGSQLFGDIMSYLRLFALGLASGSLALTFNQLAQQVHQTMPGTGLDIFLSLLILLLGHTINLLLAIMSGFVHGLRLNFIEFFNWGLTEEGYPFQAFSKKENHS